MRRDCTCAGRTAGLVLTLLVAIMTHGLAHGTSLQAHWCWCLNKPSLLVLLRPDGSCHAQQVVGQPAALNLHGGLFSLLRVTCELHVACNIQHVWVTGADLLQLLILLHGVSRQQEHRHRAEDPVPNACNA